MLYRLSYEDSPEAGPVRVQFIPVIFHFHSLSAVHSYDLYHIYIMLFSSYNGYKLNSYLICFVAQSVEPRTGVAEVMGSNPVGESEFFQLLRLLHNCEDLFRFYSLSAVHSYDLYHIHIIRERVRYLSERFRKRFGLLAAILVT